MRLLLETGSRQYRPIGVDLVGPEERSGGLTFVQERFPISCLDSPVLRLCLWEIAYA
jgi:hypothetical protein